MHLTTQLEFQKQAQLWVQEQYKMLLAEEEDQIGWRIYHRPGKAEKNE